MRQGCGLPSSAPLQLRASDRVDAAVHSSKPPGCDAAVNGVLGEADLEKLRCRDQTTLSVSYRDHLALDQCPRLPQTAHSAAYRNHLRGWGFWLASIDIAP